METGVIADRTGSDSEPTSGRAEPRREQVVGRSDLLARAWNHVVRAREGTGGVLVVRGEAGVGKSAIIAELAHAATGEGVRVLHARAEEFEEGIPYSAFRAALGSRAALEVFPPGRTADLVALMAGELDHEQAAASGRSPRLARVHADTIELVQEGLRGGPLAVVVEDVHAADPDSATLTRVLARSAASVGYLFVVSLRPEVSASARTLDGVFERMAETGDADIMDVERLDGTAVAELAQWMLSAPAAPDVVAYVVEQTHGNPFFAKELIHGLEQGGGVTLAEDGAYRLTSERPARMGRRTAILHRVFSGLPERREVAKAVAVLGRVHPARMDLVQELSGVEPAEVERSFDGLIQDRILRATHDGGYEFTHPLVRSALYDDIGPAERRRLHSAAARWLAATGDSRDRLEATAHVAESASSGDAAALELLLGSADATAVVAPRNAAAWYTRALEIMDPNDEERFDVLSRQARALWLAGRPVEAGAQGRLALAGLPEGDRARTAILTVNALYAAGAAAEALVVCDEVIEPVQWGPAPEDHPALRAQRQHIARQLGLQPIELEPLPAKPTLLVKPGVVRITHLLLDADLVGDVERRRLVLELARDTLPLLTAGPRLALLEAMAMVHADAGELADASAVMHEARRFAEGTGATNLGGQFASARVRFHRLAGDWDAAFETAKTASQELAEAQQLGNLCIVQALTSLMLVDQGRFDEADRTMADTVAPVPSFAHLLGAVRARRLRMAGDLEGALALAVPIEAEARSRGWEQWRYLLVQEMVEAQVALGRSSEAAQVLATLDPLDERPLHQVVTGRLTALLSQDAGAALVARGTAERNGLVVEAAVSAVVAARLGASDVALESALACFDTVGADPWAFQTRQLMRENGLVPPRVSGATAGSLTPIELKMARMVQQGLTNREIAGALHYSPKTVEVYLSRVYAKLGLSSRLALARVMDAGHLG